MGGPAASFGGGVLCGGGSKSMPRSGSGIAGVTVMTAGERCVLAASGAVGNVGDGKVSDSAFFCMARQPTPGSCSSTRGPIPLDTGCLPGGPILLHLEQLINICVHRVFWLRAVKVRARVLTFGLTSPPGDKSGSP